MKRSSVTPVQAPTIARTLPFPFKLHEKIVADAERCGRSFGGQVVALLRRHYGEDGDSVMDPKEILALADASLENVSIADLNDRKA